MSRGLPIPEDRPTLARFLTEHGYVTGQIGKWDIGTQQQGPLNVGFTEVAKNPPRKKYDAGGSSKYFCVDEHGETVWLTDYDGDLMTGFIERHKDKPFVLYWSPEAVHSPNKETPERLTDRTSAPNGRRKLAGAIVSVDDQVGKLLNVLNNRGLRQNTLIIFTSDNGANGSEGGSSTPYTGGKGQGTQKEGWVRVPTIFSMPGVLPEEKQYDGLIANFDFYSTIAHLTTNTIPRHCDGVDLFPYLCGEQSGDAHEYLYWLNNEPGDAERRHLIAVRWKDWRLYKKYQRDPWQLFDLKSDPREENDLAPKHPELVKQMATQHAAWKQTLAPLGEIPKIRGKEPIIPTGHGWAFAAANDKADAE